jgi:hypothetical protein
MIYPPEAFPLKQEIDQDRMVGTGAPWIFSKNQWF